MPSKANVMAGMPKRTGAIYRAPLGTTLPTDATSPLDPAFKELGYVKNEGWSRGISKSFNSIVAWGGDEVQKTRTEHSVTVSLTLIESLLGDVHTAKWGEAAVETDGNTITVTYDGAETDPAVWVIEMVDGSKAYRAVLPYAQDTTESFEQSFSSEDVIGLPFELTLYRDEEIGGFFKDFIAKTESDG